MKIFAEAVSLQEAKEDLARQVPEGWEMFREEVLFDGTKQITGCAETVDEAIQTARVLARIPKCAKVIEMKTSPPGESRKEVVEAFSEQEARSKLWDTNVSSLSLEAAGRKGFLGIGRVPGRYVATVRAMAAATVTYQYATVTAFVFPTTCIGDSCCVCGTYLAPRDIQNAKNGSEAEYVPCICDGCGQWICWWCAFHLLLARVSVSTKQADVIRSGLMVRDGKVWHRGCGGRVRSFAFLLGPR